MDTSQDEIAAVKRFAKRNEICQHEQIYFYLNKVLLELILGKLEIGLYLILVRKL